MLVANLSFSEVLLNMFYILMFSCQINSPDANGDCSIRILKDSDILSGSMIKFVYYATMVYLTLNKLLEVVLNITYQNYCSKFRGKMLLLFTWILGFVFFIAIASLHVRPNTVETPNRKYNNISRHVENTTSPALSNQTPIDEKSFSYEHVFTYFYTGLDIGFIFLAVSSHGYIFNKYRQSKRDPVITRKSSVHPHRKEESLWKVFRKSRFYISALLIMTFLFMVVLPKLVYFFIFNHIDDGLCKTLLAVGVAFLYHFSFLLDVVIYVFLHPHLKRVLLKKLSKIWFLSDMRLEQDCRKREETTRMTFLTD